VLKVFDDDGSESKINEDDTYKGCVKTRKIYMR
jgi:hypothetical protein